MANDRPLASSTDAATLVERAGAVCPYLLSSDGAWRSATPNRAHRCVAVAPPAHPSMRKQGDLCLTAAHQSCPTFLAAREAVGALGGQTLGQGRYVVPRTTPVVLDRGGRLGEVGDMVRSPRTGRVALLALMGLTVIALAIARFGGSSEGPGAGLPTPSVTTSAVASVAPSPSPSPLQSPSPSSSPSPSPSESPRPSPSPSPMPAASSSPSASASRTYVVKAGDNLSGIAARFDTTVAIIVELNGIEDPSLIRVGQVIKLP